MRELRERAEPILRIVCLILAAFVVYELAGVVLRWNPFRGVIVPELPALTVATNSPPSGPHGTNLLAAVKGTNGSARSSSTNLAQSAAIAKTNPIPLIALAGNETKDGTNLNTHAAHTLFGANVTAIPASNMAAITITGTETTYATNVPLFKITNGLGGTNIASAVTLTNGDSNLLVSTAGISTNASLKPGLKKSGAMPGMAGMNFNPFQPPGKRGADLPPAVQSRISRITDSEILGPVVRPLPMALLGIAGEFAFLRSANGQTGLVKEGDSLDDLKLLRIGINRVLIEQDGQKKELTIFSGYGSESMLQKDSSNENNHP